MRVNPQDLTKVASKLNELDWALGEVDAGAADALPMAGEAAANLTENASSLEKFQELAKAQAGKLALTFTSVAQAYTDVDNSAATGLERGAAIDAIPVPAVPGGLPPIPNDPSLAAVSAGGYSHVYQTQAALENTDRAASLHAAAGAFDRKSQRAQYNAGESYLTDWEGDAADAAYARLHEFSNWLGDLQAAWVRLKDAANKLAKAHQDAADSHKQIADAYRAEENDVKSLRAQGVPDSDKRIQTSLELMQTFQRMSDELRETYATGATFDAVKPKDPPFGSRGGGGSTGGGGNGGASGGGGGGGGGSTGGASGASGATMPESPGMQNAAQTAGSGETGGSGSGGGSSGGGSQSGGGSPSGAGEGGTGGLPGGLPDGDTGMPALPDDPSLHPASAEGGGGSGGGGGGGLGSSPLQPNLGGSAVGTSPAGVGAGGGGGPGGAAATGGMGGMGGGMPMHGAGHGQGGSTEKKRNPGLSPDENIYTEEREWTEPVIGQRRRTVADTSKDSK